jgi:deoxyribodipyrimidine photo-lyase
MKSIHSPFPASRSAALSRWESFLPRVPDYAKLRNYVVEGHPHVSGLSPAIRCRLITEEEILRSLRERFPFSTVEKFVQELLWRGYWKSWLECHPGVWADYKRQLASVREEISKNQLQRIEAIQRGGSGVAVIDHFTQELLETGYLHNHARMWWASFWIHVEKLPWPIGADFFYRHLLDGDIASNTLSWRWVAGLQTRGKAYLVRRSNIEKYLAPPMLDQRGLEQLDDDRVETAQFTDDVPHPFALSAAFDNATSLEGRRWGLWLHEEDLHPESLNFFDAVPASIRCFSHDQDDPLNKPGPLRVAYIAASLQDGLSRAADHWKINPDQIALMDIPSLVDGLLQWSNQEKLEIIVLSRPPVGFLRDQLPKMEAALNQQGVRLVTVSRPWDENLYPNAKAGFFNFWERTKAFVLW